jgi:PAS domain S-box-containing protein
MDETSPGNSHILLVHADAESVTILTSILSGRDYQVRSVSTGQSALAAARDIPADLLLLARELPDLDSYELCRRLKDGAETSSIPILFVLDNPSSDDITQLYAVGGADYVAKPFLPVEVLGRVEASLALSAAKEEIERQNAELEQEAATRIHLEAQVEAAEASGSNLVENLSEVIYTADTQGILTYVSPAIERFLGYQPSEAVGRHIREFIHEDDFPKLGERFQQVLSGHDSTGEYRARTRSGETRWMRTSSQPIVEQKRVVGVQGILTDIADRKLAEERIRSQNEFLMSILESLTHPFYVLDANNYTVLMANPAARFSSRTAQSTCYALTHRRDTPCDSTMHPCPVEEIRRTKAPVTVEHIHYDEQGNPRNVEVHGYPLLDPEGNVAQVIEYTFDVTERKQAEEALREGEARWRSVTENSPDHVILLDTDLRIQFVNYASPGLTREALVGTPLYNYVAAEQQSEIRQILERVLATAEPTSYETEYQTPQGDAICYESRVVPRLMDEKIVGLAVNARDVTQHRQAEAALRRSEAKYRQLLETLQEGIWVIDQDAITTFVNPRMAEMLGYTVEEMQGQHLYSFMDEQGAETTRRNLERRAQGIREQHDFEFLRKDGTRLYALLETSPIYDEDGNYAGGIAGIQDITERRWAEDALRRSENLLREMGRIAKVGGWELDLQTSKVTWTGEVYRIHQVPRDFEPTLETALQFYAPEDLPKLQQAIQRAIDTGDPWDLELRFATALGERLWVRAIGKAEHHNGKVVRLSGTFQDITERKQAEKAIQEAAAAAERNRLARDLHDSVTQALFSASLVAEVLPQVWKRDPEIGQQGLEELRLLTRSALAEMRTMLLELRPTALVETSLNDLLVQLTEAITSRAQLATQFDIEPMPPLPPDVHVTFYRVAQEALHNVVKHAEASQVTISLRVSPPRSTHRDGNWRGQAILHISDDGQGINPAGTEPGQLGLGIMRERAEAIGAMLTIEGRPDQGTQVTLVWSNT